MMEPNKAPKLWYAVTIGLSARKLLRGQLSYFSNAGYEVTLATSDDADAAACAESEDVRFQPLPMQRKGAPLDDLLALSRWIRVIRRDRPDIINYATPKAAFLTSIAAAVNRVPRRVYVVWGLRHEGLTGPARAALITIERIICALSTDVVAVSESVAGVMRAEKITTKPIVVVGDGSSNGVDAEAIDADLQLAGRDQVRSSLGLGANELVVAFVGRVNPDKGIATLVGAMEELAAHRNDLHLLVIGSEDDDNIAQRLLDAPFRYTVTGWVDTPWTYLIAADIFCLPTLREGFPNVVLEAAVAGIATVTTTATGAVDSVRDGTTGLLVPPGDVRRLARALRTLADDPALRHKLAMAARTRAIRDFAPQRIWTGIHRVYLESTGTAEPQRASSGEATQ